MLYKEQLNIEQLNKEIFDRITQNISAEEFINFYKTHNQKETLEKYEIRTTKQLTKILKAFNYDFSFKKALNKGKTAVRSHESYIVGGKKSAETQKNNWQNKTEEEKELWSKKQSIAHLSSLTFKERITKANRAYRASLTEEQEEEMNKRRSQSMTNWWAALSKEEREQVLAKRFKDEVSCNQKDSIPNLNFEKLLKNANLSYEREFCLNRKFFDFKIGNILIEIDPTFTHNSTFCPFKNRLPIDKNYHKDKTATATEKGYRCIHLFDWDDCSKVINLLNRTDNNNNYRLYGRQCVVKEVSKTEAKEFINKYHMQNYATDTVRLGLYNNEVLVAIMTFGKPRYNKKYQWEIIRYCSSINVIGGGEKLFKHFIAQYNPESIISYCDLSKFSGELYEKLGFTLLRKAAPSKHWYNIKTKEHFTDNLLRQQGFSRLVHKCDASKDTLTTTNNQQLMIEAGFVEVYDCGQAAYGWEK